MAERCWTEKYRPLHWDDVCSHDAVISSLRRLATPSMPHLLFHGPPGSGKTTLSMCCARSVLGSGMDGTSLLILNASERRGINNIRSLIQDFLTTDSNLPVPFKMVILDEADNLTPDAQSAMRRMMETKAESARFCLIANDVSKIIDSIVSRCCTFRLGRLADDVVAARLRWIAGKEAVDIADEEVAQIVRYARGDLRQAVNLLQGRQTPQTIGESDDDFVTPERYELKGLDLLDREDRGDIVLPPEFWKTYAEMEEWIREGASGVLQTRAWRQLLGGVPPKVTRKNGKKGAAHPPHDGSTPPGHHGH